MTENSYIATDRFLLTNFFYRPGQGELPGSWETGVRTKGEDAWENFQLIQHGWLNIDKAGKVILNRLERGRSISQIDRLMDFMKSRGLDKK